MANNVADKEWLFFADSISHDLLNAGFKLNKGRLFEEINLNKGRFLSYISEINSINNPELKVGFFYQVTLTTDSQCSTYELSIAMPESHVRLFEELKKQGYKNFIMIPDMREADFDGVSFEGLKNFMKVALSKNPSLLGSITILPHNAARTIMTFYSSLLPKIFGVKKVEESIEIILKLLKKI